MSLIRHHKTGYNVSDQNYQRVVQTQGAHIEKISRVPKKLIARDLLDVERAEEQLGVLKRYMPGGALQNKKILEIGSGLGIFQLVARKKYGMDAWGIEPSSDGFNDAYAISQDILHENGLETEHILIGHAEKLTFHDNDFDIVFSSNVLEHANDPKRVLQEAIRVCKHGGIIQIVVPNFGSFFDGHYACFYVPYQPKWFWKLYLRHVLRRDPDFVDTLRTEVNYFFIKKVLQPYEKRGTIDIITLGEEIFRERMQSMEFTPWGGLAKIQKLLIVLHKLRIITLVTNVLLATKAHSPLIITLKKK